MQPLTKTCSHVGSGASLREHEPMNELNANEEGEIQIKRRSETNLSRVKTRMARPRSALLLVGWSYALAPPGSLMARLQLFRLPCGVTDAQLIQTLTLLHDASDGIYQKGA